MPTNAKRILLVDDDPDLCKLVTASLKESFTVVACDSAEAALVRSGGIGAFDLLIVDVMLPGMSGIDFLRKVRTSDAPSAVPVLMITSNLGEDMRQRCRAAGASAFIYKPFTVLQLRTTIEKLLDDPNAKLIAAFAAHSRR
jgi:DNA-binding response OmpR family regulator